MSQRSLQVQETMYGGIDVSAKSLAVAIQRVRQPVEQKSFPNNPNGHRALIVWLRKAKSPVRVSLEATGIYSLDLAFALDAAEGIEVAVLNSKVANRFAQTIRRSKTDAADAEVLAEYTHRMPFTAWIAPSASSMRLRAIVRHVETLGTSRPFLCRALRSEPPSRGTRLRLHTWMHCSGFEALCGVSGAPYPRTSARSDDARPAG
jgi:transposase